MCTRTTPVVLLLPPLLPRAMALLLLLLLLLLVWPSLWQQRRKERQVRGGKEEKIDRIKCVCCSHGSSRSSWAARMLAARPPMQAVVIVQRQPSIVPLAGFLEAHRQRIRHLAFLAGAANGRPLRRLRRFHGGFIVTASHGGSLGHRRRPISQRRGAARRR